MKDTTFIQELWRFAINHKYLRYGQIIVNFQSWLKLEKQIDDIFYIPDDKLCQLFYEYSHSTDEKLV